jgi:hypothetical protein
MSPSWQVRRSKFNHDWLKNRYLPAVAKWINILDGLLEDPEFERLFPTAILPQWEAQSINAVGLIDAFSREMSPGTLMNEPIFRQLPASTRSWLAPLVTELWLNRNPVVQWQENAKEALVQAGERYSILQRTLSTVREPAGLSSPELLKQFGEFRDACQQVAKCIEAFPSDVLVT